MGKVFITTDVLGSPHWGIGEGLTLLRLASALVFCPLCALLAAPTLPQDKKAGAAHENLFLLTG